MSHVTLGRPCHIISRTKQSKGKKAKQRKERERQAKQTKAKQKRSKSNCDATTVTCYPRAGVSHVTLGGQVYHFGGERDVELEGEDGSQGSEVLQHS